MSVKHPTQTGRPGEKPIEKAARFLREDRVLLVPDVHVYRVLGDTASYDVIAGPDGIFCPCEARTPLCAHVLAVAQVRLRDHVLPAGLLADATGAEAFRLAQDDDEMGV